MFLRWHLVKSIGSEEWVVLVLIFRVSLIFSELAVLVVIAPSFRWRARRTRSNGRALVVTLDLSIIFRVGYLTAGISYIIWMLLIVFVPILLSLVILVIATLAQFTIVVA